MCLRNSRIDNWRIIIQKCIWNVARHNVFECVLPAFLADILTNTSFVTLKSSRTDLKIIMKRLKKTINTPKIALKNLKPVPNTHPGKVPVGFGRPAVLDLYRPYNGFHAIAHRIPAKPGQGEHKALFIQVVAYIGVVG
jgi:hypothetical protein